MSDEFVTGVHPTRKDSAFLSAVAGVLAVPSPALPSIIPTSSPRLLRTVAHG